MLRVRHAKQVAEGKAKPWISKSNEIPLAAILLGILSALIKRFKRGPEKHSSCGLKIHFTLLAFQGINSEESVCQSELHSTIAL